MQKCFVRKVFEIVKILLGSPFTLSIVDATLPLLLLHQVFLLDAVILPENKKKTKSPNYWQIND